MDLGLTGRAALVTGASKGIGRATAEVLALEGCDVHLVARTESELNRAAEEIGKKTGRTITYSALDLSVSENVDALCSNYSHVDIVVNNAGAIPAGTIDAIEEARWREAWDLKVFGYINMMRRMYAAMRGRGGVIINVIGTGGERPLEGYAAGAGGNAALMATTRALGGHSIKHKVRIVGINPGLIMTDRLITMQRVFAETSLGDAERWQEMLDPDFPPGQPEHIADMVAFLASDRSGNTTGTVITVDGGGCSR